MNPGGGGGNASCATAFSLNGSKYDVSALQVDVGGWVAENSVDKFSCAPNAPSLVCLHAAPSRASFGCPGRWLVWLRTAAGSADCINVCAVVTSERNCICYPCGATEYPASQVDKDPVKGETCEACEPQPQTDAVPLSLCLSAHSAHACRGRADLGELKSSTWSASTDPEKPGITLTYGDGQQGKSTELALICDESVSGLDTGPSFVGSAAAAEPSVFRFEWVTSAACPLNSTQALA